MAIHRAGIWGLAAAGDAAVPGLLSMLGDDDVGIVQRAAHALSEAAEHPDASVVKVRCAAETRSHIPARARNTVTRFWLGGRLWAVRWTSSAQRSTWRAKASRWMRSAQQRAD